MPPKKTAPPVTQRSLPEVGSQPAAPAASSGRKPWIKRTPIEVVLEQIGKQEQRVAQMREELAKEERELKKFQQVRDVLES